MSQSFKVQIEELRKPKAGVVIYGEYWPVAKDGSVQFGDDWDETTPNSCNDPDIIKDFFPGCTAVRLPIAYMPDWCDYGHERLNAAKLQRKARLANFLASEDAKSCENTDAPSGDTETSERPLTVSGG